MIYYVEDDTNIRDLTVYALRQAGFEAQGFPAAGEFFAACRERAPELVLLDIMLPRWTVWRSCICCARIRPPSTCRS